MDDPGEKAHFKQVVSAFFFYENEAAPEVARMERDFYSMPQRHLNLLSFDYKKDRIMKLKQCIKANQNILSLVVQEYQNLFQCEKLNNGNLAIM
jgi:carnosine N-methyltransferase